MAQAKRARLKKIKKQIEDGTYETKDKLLVAIKRLLKDLPNYDESGRPRK